MPIRINLLAESQAAEEMRRRDPVKRAIWIGGFVVAVALIGALSLQLKITAVRLQLSSADSSWKGIESKVKQVEEQRRQANSLQQKLSAIEQFTTNRLLWASVLNALQGTAVDNVQLVRIKTEQQFVLNEGTKPRTNGTVIVPGRPATVTEKAVLTLDGKDWSARQADQVPKYKDSLVTIPYFVDHLQTTNKAQLTSLSAPQLDGSRAYVGFALQLFFQDKERRLYE
jgi:hypothetical protein